ncbi:hypothetical protein Tsubulata_014717, partial [Turnera subulata]
KVRHTQTLYVARDGSDGEATCQIPPLLHRIDVTSNLQSPKPKTPNSRSGTLIPQINFRTLIGQIRPFFLQLITQMATVPGS